MDEVQNKKYICREVPAKIAREYVRTYHYSGKVVNNSRLHLGMYAIDEPDNLRGILQYGYPMNPNATPGKIVEGSDKSEMYELNRMAMHDDEPHNSESQAISLSFKWIKKFKPEIKWLLSFSDGKENNVGYIYQATNWKYLGYRESDSFYLLDGKYMHAVPIYNKYRQHDTTGRTTNQILFDTFHDVSIIKAKQHIYVYSLDKKIKYMRDEKPYPKMDLEKPIIGIKFLKQDGIIIKKPTWIVPDDGMIDTLTA